MIRLAFLAPVAAIGLLAASAPPQISHPAHDSVVQIGTNQAGHYVWVATTNTATVQVSPFLDPPTAALVYTSLLNHHMEAVRYGWVQEEQASAKYRWLEDRLLALTLHAPLSDWEREVMRAEESRLRTRVAELERQLRTAAAEAKRQDEEIANLKDRLRDRNPPPR